MLAHGPREDREVADRVDVEAAHAVVRDGRGLGVFGHGSAPRVWLHHFDGRIGLEPQLGTDALVALGLELVRQLRPASLHDTPLHHHVDRVGRDVVQHALVVRDQEHTESGPDELVDALGDQLQRVDVEPESVSSRIAICGCSTASWSTSFRFFSPPEKPWFVSVHHRVVDAEAVHLLLHVLAERQGACSPFTAWYAVRRKFTTETPGTSVGYCIARNSPRLARSSGVSAVMSSPLNPPSW